MEAAPKPRTVQRNPPDDAQQHAARFAALGHEARVRIVRSLLQAHPDGRVAGEIQQQLDIPTSTLSHHLDALRREGLVTQQREGRYLRYRAGTQALRALLDFLYAECCGGANPIIQIGAAPRQTSTPRG
ncbi:MAG: metalloregulator ArsR/SmtB family transcription factor [Acidobacteriota bacterium]